MALIVEDGSLVAGAESYASVTAADTLLGGLGFTLWATMSVTEREQALRRGTRYMVQTYRLRWKGVRLTATQSLDWPREWVEREDYYLTGSTPPDSVDGTFYYPSDEVPSEVVEACCMFAYKAASGDLSEDLTTPVIRERVGPIETEYQQGGRQTVRYQSLDALLAPFLKGGGSQSFVRVVRA